MDTITICDKKECTGCSVCVDVCPMKCISMKEDLDGFVYPIIDNSMCVRCKKCQKTCPNNKIFKKETSEFYMAIHKDIDVLKNSSSGGAFTALADMVLDKNGIVCGAFFDAESREVKHIIINSKGELDFIRRSKYYQSSTVGIYKQIKAALEEKQWVLFSGTACQIAALYAIIPESSREMLITVDILCHGVSSKKVIDAFLESQEKKFKKHIVNYRFRIKDSEIGWKLGGGTKMLLKFEDGTTYIDRKFVDDFFMAFNNNSVLRESCYQCKYCGTERISDFTIADFWGVGKNRATLEQQEKGISLLVCNSSNSKKMLRYLTENMVISEIYPEEAIPFNKAFVEPNKRPIERDRLFDMLNKNIDFHKIIIRLYWKEYVKYYFKKIFGEKTFDKIRYTIKNKGGN